MDNNKLDRIEEKLSLISDTTIRQQVTLENLTRSVEEHVRRSNLLEESIKPLQAHASRVDGVLKFLGLVSTLTMIAGSVWKWTQ